ncbi:MULTISPECIES: dihydrolipoyl dehydrogenase [unclassified Dysgonomonas]|jgi:dihydrolipoamide dehydrogenase|uniref:dihydrolipoyl dehydrogenase n=1 Tax=unclassified Dysgonomonas TaxID=2630389 RepID=UPI0025C5E574|nr:MULTISPECIES: dihydrolipoyl dehydrogenase [unclassified Dysgonomonas]MDR2005135.1 dihydrolipoyl dehydrogenase [Prevotella sp.]HMM02345.1 dihydrolipoyl dehydrogenase [Dysgonomonas sp.]
MLYDIAIIGGGPAGYTAAERAAANGLKTILFEKNTLGGVCLNEGCIPTKTLLYSAKTLDNIKNSAKYGVSVEGQPGFDLSKIIARKQKTVRKLVAGIKQKMAAHEVEIIGAEVHLIGEDNSRNILLGNDDETYTAKYVLLCTGSGTIVPPIKGLDTSGYWTSKEALDNKDVPQSLAIIGGGVIGVEFASFFNSLGVKVSVIEMLPEILGAMDKELSAMLRTEYSKRGIDFYLGTKVVEIRGGEVIIEKDGEQSSVEAAQILLSTGRRPVTANLNIDKLNIEMYRNGIKVDEFMKTSHPRVYACGDITGHSLLAHTAVREGEVAVNHILGKADRMSYKAIPGVVYTNPEIAGAGQTEEELTVKGIKHTVLKLPMAYSGRFVAENELVNGMCKLIIGENEKIIGCHMLGNPASELIVIAGIAIEKEFTVEEFRKIVFPHPTVGEIIHETLFI